MASIDLRSASVRSAPGWSAFADDVNVRDLEDAGLDGLDIVAQAWRRDDDRGVGGARDLDLVLADADRLDDDDVETGRVEDVDRVQRATGESAERAVGGHAAHEDAGVTGDVAHADAVAQDRAAGERGRRVDGDDADAAPGAADLRGELRHQRRLAAARHAGDPDDVRAAGVPEDRVQRRRHFVRRPRPASGAARSRVFHRPAHRERGRATRPLPSPAIREARVDSRNTSRSSMTRRALKSVRGNVPGATTSTLARSPSIRWSFCAAHRRAQRRASRSRA